MHSLFSPSLFLLVLHFLRAKISSIKRIALMYAWIGCKTCERKMKRGEWWHTNFVRVYNSEPRTLPDPPFCSTVVYLKTTKPDYTPHSPLFFLFIHVRVWRRERQTDEWRIENENFLYRYSVLPADVRPDKRSLTTSTCARNSPMPAFQAGVFELSLIHISEPTRPY